MGLAAGVVLLFVMACGGVLLPVTPAFADASDGVQVSLNAVNEVSSGTDFTATIDISQVENFDACNYDVSFDPAVLRLDNVTSGDIGGTVVPVDIWNEISTGTFTIVQNVPGVPGVTGTGYLAVLHFHVIGSQGQDSNIGLSNGVLASILAEAIPATWTGGSVHVNSAGTGGQGVPPAQDSPSESETTDVSDEGSEEVAAPAPAAPSEQDSPSESETTDVSDEDSEEIAAPAPPTPPATESLPESETADVSAAVPTPEPPAPPLPAQPEPTAWPVIWGVVGGVVIVFGLIIFFRVRRRSY